MSTPLLGIGICPAGASIAGYGQPATGNSIQNTLLPNQNGVSQDGILIDWSIGDISFNVSGNLTGMNSVLQQVQITCLTALGSSCLPNLGTNLFSKNNNSANNNKIITSITTALQPLLQQKFISQLKITATPTANGAGIQVVVSFFNNSLKTIQSLNFSPLGNNR